MPGRTWAWTRHDLSVGETNRYSVADREMTVSDSGRYFFLVEDRVGYLYEVPDTLLDIVEIPLPHTALPSHMPSGFQFVNEDRELCWFAGSSLVRWNLAAQNFAPSQAVPDSLSLGLSQDFALAQTGTQVIVDDLLGRKSWLWNVKSDSVQPLRHHNEVGRWQWLSEHELIFAGFGAPSLWDVGAKPRRLHTFVAPTIGASERHHFEDPLIDARTRMVVSTCNIVHSEDVERVFRRPIVAYEWNRPKPVLVCERTMNLVSFLDGGLVLCRASQDMDTIAAGQHFVFEIHTQRTQAVELEAPEIVEEVVRNDLRLGRCVVSRHAETLIIDRGRGNYSVFIRK